MRLAHFFCTASLLSVAAISSPARAGPDETTTYLMNERVSLLDWGILRMEMYLRDLKVREMPMFTSVQYLWDVNQIVITGLVYGTVAAKDAIPVCREGVALVRRMLGVDEKTGKPFGKDKYTNAAGMFQHEGHAPRSEPRDWPQKLDKLMVVRVSVFSGKNIKCEGKLTGVEILSE